MKVGQFNPAAAKTQTQTDAHTQLLDMKNKLVAKGSIESGYLRLSKAGTMNVGGFLTKGSKGEAAQAIKDLVYQAYGDRLARCGKSEQLQQALDTYLSTTGNAFGSKSFVKLIDMLESNLMRPQQAKTVAAPIKQLADAGRLAAVKFASSDKMVSDSPVSAAAQASFRALESYLGAEVFEHFSQLMFPDVSTLNAVQAASAQAPRAFVMGDADGSMGRMVLHAMASGVATLPSSRLEDLAMVLQHEYEEDLDKFQASQEVSAAHVRLAADIQINSQANGSFPVCIYLGDILSDRFTNNQEAMATLIYKLSGFDPADTTQARAETGVRFIAGNHDTAPNTETNVQWGGKAAVKLTDEAYGNLLFNCFNAALYEGGVFSSHNGIAASEVPGYYQTGLTVEISDEQFAQARQPDDRLISRLKGGTKVEDSLRLQASDPQHLADQMNQIFKERVKGKNIDLTIATDFRPQDRYLTPQALGFDGIPGFRQLHGHEGTANEIEPGVTNLNARDSVAAYAPMSKVIDYAVAV